MRPDLRHVGPGDLDLSDHVLMPGFVDAHTHDCMERGRFEDMPFMVWLEKYAQPKDRIWFSSS